MDKLIPSFKDSIFNDDSKSLLAELGELGIDSVLENGILKELPIVGTLIGVGKTVQKLSERNLLKQTMVFIKTLNDKSINPEKKEQYLLKLNNNPNFAEQELGRVLLLLNSIIDDIKSRHLGMLFAAYIEGVISWTYFSELAEINGRLSLLDIYSLKYIYFKSEYEDSERFDRLSLFGLTVSRPMLMFDVLLKGHEEKDFLTNLGKKYCEIVFQ